MLTLNLDQVRLPKGYRYGAHHSSGFASGYWVIRESDGKGARVFSGCGRTYTTADELDYEIEQQESHDN